MSKLAGPPIRSFTIGQLALARLKFATGYYVKNDQPTSQIHVEKAALRALVALYETEQAVDFGPLKLKTLQQYLSGKNLCRKTVNSLIGIIKRAFKWAASEELVPATVFHALQTVGGLKRGRCTAKESEPVGPVDDATVNATIKYLPPVVQAMVHLQLLTGMRPGEVCILRPCDLTMQLRGPWVYRPSSHKTEHRNRDRRIFIGPQGQTVLRPYLDRAPMDYCFSPQESMNWRNKLKRIQRKSPMTPSQLDRRPKATPERSPRDRYTVASYRRASADARLTSQAVTGD